MNSYIWPTAGNLTGATTLSPSGPESNGYESLFNISQTLGPKLHQEMQFSDIPRFQVFSDRVEVECCRSLDHFGSRSRTTKLPGSRPQALSVDSQARQLASLDVFFLNTPLQSWNRQNLQPQPTRWLFVERNLGGF